MAKQMCIAIDLDDHSAYIHTSISVMMMVVMVMLSRFIDLFSGVGLLI